MTSEQAGIIAESYINGNISWVKEQIGKSLKKFILVYDFLATNVGQSEADDFMRMIYRGL